MSILNVENMTHGFGEKTVFDNVSFRLLKGEHVGLIGANGEGKTTFMNIITNKLLPDSGNIEWSKKVSVGYMDQHTNLKEGKVVREVLKEAFNRFYKIEEEMNSLYNNLEKMNENDMIKNIEKATKIQEYLEKNDFYSINSRVEGTAKGLGIDELLNRNVNKLSGGQRTKVLLAKLLLEKPDILLLDEPTNYLDKEHIDFLTAYLKNYENAFILISHEMEFLNNVVNVIWHIENRKMDRYSGNYDKFLKLHDERRKQLISNYNKQQREIEKLEDYIRRNKVRSSTAQMAHSREKKLNKIERIEIKRNLPKPHFYFKPARTSGRLILETKDLVIGYDKPLTKKLNLKVERGDKIALIGANGIGKTTLLKSLMGLIDSLSGKIEYGEYGFWGYFEQEVKGSNRNTALEEMWNEYPNSTKYEMRSALAKCGLTEEHIRSEMTVLSGGEQAKVRLCKLLNKQTNILILDEPTNHLDIIAKEELKRALKEYEGTVLLVCHEPEFYDGLANSVWNCEEWCVNCT